MMISERIGTATNRPTNPNSWPTTTTPIAITAGCSRTRWAMMIGIVTLLSSCCTRMYAPSTSTALPGESVRANSVGGIAPAIAPK